MEWKDEGESSELIAGEGRYSLFQHFLDAKIEAQFRAERNPKQLGQTRLGLALGTLLFAAFFAIDRQLDPAHWVFALSLRLAVTVLLGLCFAACVPDAINHHLRVGLGYLRYRGVR